MGSSEKRFKRCLDENRLFAVRRGGVRFFERLISQRNIDDLFNLATTLCYLKIKINHPKHFVDENEYSSFDTIHNSRIKIKCDTKKALRIAKKKGAQITLEGFQYLIQPLCELLSNLSRELNWRSQVVLRLSPKTSLLQPANEEKYDQMILQISGKAQWQVFKNRRPKKIKSQLSSTAFLSVLLKPGDMLLIPKGKYFQQNPLGEGSEIIIKNYQSSWAKVLANQSLAIGVCDGRFRHGLQVDFKNSSVDIRKKFFEFKKKILASFTVETVEPYTVKGNLQQEHGSFFDKFKG